MKSNYKQLGEYIREVDLRNRNLQIDNLIGLSVDKIFIKSKSNTIGTDMSTYRIINPKQFAYCPVTSRNGERITIALYEENETAIISQAYNVFEVIDTDELLPEYLMMWFRRPEFDRYARFKSHGSVREMFDWEEMCNVLLAVPTIEKQREIVKEYNVIADRIKLNNRLIDKLEETAQAIYKRWFVEFEFPDKDGKAYKSNGGEMEYCKELEKEVPKGWKNKFLDEFTILSQGIQVEVEDQYLEKYNGFNRFLRIIDYTPNTDEQPRYVNIKDERYFCSCDEIAMIRYGDAGAVCRRFEGIIANNLFKISPQNGLTNNFLYYFLKDVNIQQLIRTSAASSTMPAITHTAIKELPILFPFEKLIGKFNNIAQKIENKILIKIKEIVNLKAFINILLSKLATIEN